MVTWGDDGATVLVASTWVNVANFVLFDIVLISILFFVTTDIAGRFNHKDIYSGDPYRLFLICPPLIGGGLGSTSSFRISLLLIVRMFGIGLIFVSNFAISGKSVVDTIERNVTIVTPGSVENFSVEDILKAVDLRSNCWITQQNTPEQGVLVYGEIRNGECSQQPDVLDNAVQISLGLNFHNISTGKCQPHEVRTGQHSRRAIFACDYANILCYFEENNPRKVKLDTCRAWIEYKNESYVVDNMLSLSIQVRPGMPETPIEAFKAKNLDASNIDWLSDKLWDFTFNVIDDVHAIYGAGRENRTVKEDKTVPATTVARLWFIVLGLKVVLTLLLILTSISLWAFGYRPMANDEKNLVKILQRRVEENNLRQRILAPNDRSSVYLLADLNDSNNRVQVFATGKPLASATTEEDRSDPNYRAHVEEARSYLPTESREIRRIFTRKSGEIAYFYTMSD